ncbi:MAG: aspartate/glutamate racemase family protein, partial [Desulfobacterales bacterium]|nr:aspartate/glutamate racemase family protein [Desulfobacterales bacterium]
MKTIGMIGGMSWESTSSYYTMINEGIKEALGGLHSAKIALYSVDFSEIETLQHEGRWQEAGEVLAQAGRGLVQAGADFLMICTNTMHKVADEVEKASGVPLLHIADATGEVLKADGVETVGLLGTSFTMEEAFYKGRLTEKFGLDVVIPDEKERAEVHRVIFDELCAGKMVSTSKERYQRIIERLEKEGADAVILGCTEIGLLVKPVDSLVRLYDTTAIHAQAAVKMALQ